MKELLSITKIAKRASETLLVRFPAILTFAAFPPSVGLFLFFFSNPAPPEGNFWFQIHSLQDTFVEDYIRGLQIGLVLSLAFFITFRWNQIIKDRSYGYWLSQGVDRGQFFLYSAIQFLSIIGLGIFLGQLVLFYPGGVQFQLERHIRMIFILFSSAFLTYAMAVVVAEIIKDPEIGLLVFVAMGLLNSSIAIDGAGIFQMTFLSGRFIINSSSPQPLIMPFLVGSLFLFVANLLHKRRDIDL